MEIFCSQNIPFLSLVAYKKRDSRGSKAKSGEAQFKFDDIVILISRDTCDRADAVPFGEIQIFGIFGLGDGPNINQIN